MLKLRIYGCIFSISCCCLVLLTAARVTDPSEGDLIFELHAFPESASLPSPICHSLFLQPFHASSSFMLVIQDDRDH